MVCSVDPLREYLIWRRYAYRFRPSFGGALLLGLFSIANNTTTSLSYYALALSLPDEIAFATGVVLCLTFQVGQVMLAEGFRVAPRILIPVAIVNVLLAVGYLGDHSPTLLNSSTLVSALLYILVLNSRNHRRYTSLLRVKRRRKVRASAPLPRNHHSR